MKLKSKLSIIMIYPFWSKWTFQLAMSICLLSMQMVEAQLTTTFTRPVQESNVATSESGVIVESLVVEGSVVQKGQILAKLNDAPLRESLRLAALRASSSVRLKAAKYALEMKTSHSQSLKELLDKGHGNQREFDLANMQLESATADYELALEQQKEAAIELAKIEAELELRIIRSPMDGIVNSIAKEPGEYIASNDPIFCNVVRTDKLRADFYLDRETFLKLKDKTEVLVRVTANEVDNNQNIVTAKLIFRSPTLDPKSETARISVEIDNSQNQFLSGGRCELVLNPPQTSPPRLSSRIVQE